MNDWGFTPRELRVLRGVKTPSGVQGLLDAMPYHLGDTAWSPRRVLRERTAHCLEGAIFGAALRVLGYPPLLLDMESVPDDTDHVIAVFRERGRWGAVAKSNYSGLRYREPVYRGLRELAMSYFEGYVDMRGRRTLRTFSRPVNLARFDRVHPGWMTSERSLWWIPEYLVDIPRASLDAGDDARSHSRGSALGRAQRWSTAAPVAGGADRGPLRHLARNVLGLPRLRARRERATPRRGSRSPPRIWTLLAALRRRRAFTRSCSWTASRRVVALETSVMRFGRQHHVQSSVKV